MPSPSQPSEPLSAAEIDASERGFHELLKWRLSYQAHRSGASRGARGEVGQGLSAADVRMLPVAELAAHVRQLAAAGAVPRRGELSVAVPQPGGAELGPGARR